MAKRPGPPPNPNRRRRNRPDIEPTRLQPTGSAEPFEIPEHWRDELHPFAIDFVEAVARSGQSQTYQPSDWWRVLWAARQITYLIEQGRRQSGPIYAALQKEFDALLISEPDRRRAQIWIDGGEDDGEEHRAELAVLDEYRRAVGDDE